MNRSWIVRLMGTTFLLSALASAGWSQQGQSHPSSGAQAGGQATGQAAGETTAQAGKQAEGAVRAGTKINAQLESAVDARTAKPGDEVAAKVTKDVKQNGKTVVHKGDRLLGRVQSVHARGEGKGDAGSSVSVMFDRLASGEATSQLHTVVSAIFSTPAERQSGGEPEPMPAPVPAPVAGGGSGGGSLVGGATGAVGSTAGAVAGAAGSAVGTAGSAVGGVGSTVGSTVGATAGAAGGATLATPSRMIHLGAQAQGEGQGSTNSILSTRDGNLRLDSGTQMQFRVAGDAQASKSAKKPADKPAATPKGPSGPSTKN